MNWSRLLLVASIAASPSCSGEAESQAPRRYDILIRGGTVVDGTGAPRFEADVAIRGDLMALVDRSGIAAEQATQVIEAKGLVVAPGFIDMHAHVATSIHLHPLAENFLRQGITTIVASLHSGDQPYPLRDYMAALRVAPNIGFFAGHSWVRTEVMGLQDREPTGEEMRRMKALVEEGMKDGALGLSTGLLYVPANFAKTEEVVELAKVAAAHGGIYLSHMRDEASGLLDSVSELIRIAEEARIPAQIQHHKAVGLKQWGWSEKTLSMIDEARKRGLDITHDLYPYTASSTRSSVLFPQWALAGGPAAFAGRISDPAVRRKIESEMREIFVNERGGDLKRVQIRVLPSDPAYNGRTLADVVADRRLAPTVESAIRVLIDLELQGGFLAIYHSMDEEDVRRIMRHPFAMFETDGDPVGYGVGYPHPRSYGSFARVLGRYVREEKVLTLEDAIRRMTSLAADRIGQRGRGRIREGAFADLTIFDPDAIGDRAGYTDPHQYAAGVRHMLINGVVVMRDGALTGERPGRPLRGPAQAK